MIAPNVTTIAVYVNQGRSKTGFAYELKSPRLEPGSYVWIKEEDTFLLASQSERSGFKKRQVSIRDRTVRLNVFNRNVQASSRRPAIIEDLGDGVLKVSGYDVKKRWL